VTALAIGSSVVCGVVATWEILDEMVDGTVLVRYRLASHPDDVWYSRDLREGDGLRSLCRCTHMREDHARHCRDADRRMADVLAEQARVRTAALPAPDGARFLTCCAGYWSATIGGACPTCGALGAVLVPEVDLEARPDGTMTVRTNNVHAYHALSDAGLTSITARVVDDAWGSVYRSAGLTARTMGDRLAALGWRVKGRKVAQPSIFGGAR
jgi:hypothetical protein